MSPNLPAGRFAGAHHAYILEVTEFPALPGTEELIAGREQ